VLGVLFILLIPGLGLLFALLWSCGLTGSKLIKKLAYAYLILLLVVLVLCAGCWFFWPQFAEAVRDIFSFIK